MKFSCTTLLCLVARGSTKQGEEIFSDFHKTGMKMQLFGSNILANSQIDKFSIFLLTTNLPEIDM